MKMAPAANTARQRRTTGPGRALADTDSDAEYQAYNGRLREASAARTRLRKAKQNRDKNRTALATAYESALKQIESRVQKSVAKHKDLRSAIHISHLRQLKQAMDRRDEKVGQIARKLAEHQRRMLNLAVQLKALYEGRKEDVAALLKGVNNNDDDVDRLGSKLFEKGLGGEEAGSAGGGGLRMNRLLGQRVAGGAGGKRE